jgi:CBS domain-containing protein
VKVQDVMTRDVISVGPQTTVHDVAALMAEKRISGVPVVTETNMVIGVVSQSDLIHRAELGTDRRRKWWLRVFSDDRQLAKDFSQSHGQTARDVMVRHVVTIRADAELGEAAELLDSHRVKRLPVVDNGKLVGMLTRTDLVRALAATRDRSRGEVGDDAALHKTLFERMRQETWLNRALVSATVKNGHVTITGIVEGSEQRDALRVLAEEVAGIGKADVEVSTGLPLMTSV